MDLEEPSSGTPQVPFKAPSFTSYRPKHNKYRPYPHIGKGSLGTVDSLHSISPDTIYSYQRGGVRFCLFSVSFFNLFCPFQFVSVRFCLYLSISVQFFPFLTLSFQFCPSLTISFCFVSFCPLQSIFVRFCYVLSVSVRFCLFLFILVCFCRLRFFSLGIFATIRTH